MKRAFTLIELLVVIAIIAILAAILFPVFAQAKAAAKKTQALSNAKQTSMGILMYMNDSDDVFPVGSGCAWFYPWDGGWAWDTQPYIKSLPILRDPSDPLSKAWYQTWFDKNATVNISFASNGLQAWDGAAAKWNLFGVMGMNQGPQTITPRCTAGNQWMGNMITNSGAVTQSADTILLAGRYNGDNMFGQGDMLSGVNWWDYSGPGMLPDGSLDGTQPYKTGDAKGNQTVINKDQRFGAIAAVYANNGIFTFTDGHAKAMNPVATNPNPSTQPSKNMWNARR